MLCRGGCLAVIGTHWVLQAPCDHRSAERWSVKSVLLLSRSVELEEACKLMNNLETTRLDARISNGFQLLPPEHHTASGNTAAAVSNQPTQSATQIYIL